jgi:hypothetical protein
MDRQVSEISSKDQRSAFLAPNVTLHDVCPQPSTTVYADFLRQPFLTSPAFIAIPTKANVSCLHLHCMPGNMSDTKVRLLNQINCKPAAQGLYLHLVPHSSGQAIACAY